MKLLATDLDGTLFYPKDKKNMICEENLKLVRDFIDDGNKVILVSGRSLDYCEIVKKKINRECDLICFNGALVKDSKEIINSQKIKNYDAINLIKSIMISYKLPGVFIMTNHGVFIELHYKTKILNILGKAYYKTQKNYAEKYHFKHEEFINELKTGDIYKIMFFFGVRMKRQHLASEVNKFLRNVLFDYEANWSNNVIEITAKNCYKAYALEQYVSKYNINRKNVYVVGDSGNDISMFNAFHENSFCLSHANPIVSKYAKHIINKFCDLSLYILEK